MIDRTLILRKLSALEEYYKQIAEYRSISTEQYAKDWKSQRIIERTLQMMVETCIDIAGHIISDMKFRIPTSYADSFSVLAENGVVANSLSQSLEKMAKFRNVVVHDYDCVDAEIVTGILRKNLDDFNKFIAAIVNFIKKEGQKMR
jgi:uncharacterized protein YutE (UPF0331/DUF86 family)